MLADEVWVLTGIGSDGWLFVGCCEARLGRQLTRGDFELGELDYAPAGPLLRSHLA